MQRFLSFTRGFIDPGLSVSKIPAILSGVLLALASSSAYATIYTLDIVGYGHAPTDGVSDARPAIQATIDAVKALLTNPNDRGIVTFPAGTFSVKVNEELSWRWVDGTHNQPVACLFMYKNITLKGAGQTSSIVKLFKYDPRFQVPRYLSMILFPDVAMRDAGQAYWYYSGDSTNFSMVDLALDGFSDYNRVDIVAIGDPINDNFLVSADASRQGLVVSTGTGISLQNCRFQNFSTATTVTFGGGYPIVASVDHCTFTQMGGGHTFVDPNSLIQELHDYDVSSLYVQTEVATASLQYPIADSFSITNSIFERRPDGQPYGVRTAMELHGPNINVASNTINGYATGVNVVGHVQSHYESTPVARQVYSGNTFNDVASGFSIWSVYGLVGTRIENNVININTDSWIAATPRTLSPPVWLAPVGISFVAQQNFAAVDGMQITGNTITFSPQSLTTRGNFPSHQFGELGVGMVIGAPDNHLAGADVWWYAPVRDLVIRDNNIYRPLSNGIFLNGNVQRPTISNNRIEDPGSSPYNPYTTTTDETGAQMLTKYTAALRVGGSENTPCPGLCLSPPPRAALTISVPGIGNPFPNTFVRTVGRVTMGFGIHTDRATTLSGDPYWVGGTNDFLTSQMQWSLGHYFQAPNGAIGGDINCDWDGTRYLAPCFGWTLRAQ